MALGRQLLDARRKRNLTASEVAAATRVKIQFIEAIESENFDKFPAPIYGKGFIKLYADYVGLDPEPLIDEYMNRHVGDEAGPDLAAAEVVPATPAAAKPIESAPASRPTARPDSEYDLFNVTTDTAEKDPPPKNDDHPMRHGADWRGRLEAVAASAGQAGAKVRAHTNELRQSLKQRLTELAIERDPWKIVPIAAVVIVIFIFLASGLSRCVRSPLGDEEGGGAEAGRTELAVQVPEPYFD